MSKMADNTNELIEILKSQIEVENAALEEITKAEENAEETAVRLVYLDVRLDTVKHIKFLEGVIETLGSTPCDLWMAKVSRYVDRLKLERTLRSVKSKEQKMASLAQQATQMMKDPIGGFLLEHLHTDEMRHDQDMEKVIRIVQQLPLQSKKGQKGTDIKCEQ